VPALASLEAFAQAVAEFPVSDPGLVLEPAARAAAERSVRESGFLLLGEVHGSGRTRCSSGRCCTHLA
jgi:hypothetical protein